MSVCASIVLYMVDAEHYCGMFVINSALVMMSVFLVRLLGSVWSAAFIVVMTCILSLDWSPYMSLADGHM